MLNKNNQPYIIAEIGANHNGDMELGAEMIRVAKKIGCDAVKFQSFGTDLFVKDVYEQNKFLGDGRDLSDLRTAVETYIVSKEDLIFLKKICDEVGIDFASSAFEASQAQDLVDLDAAFIKIASMDVTNDELLTAVAGMKKPLLLSTGMASLSEIAHAVETLEAGGAKDITILQCTSVYPAPLEGLNLNNIPMLEKAFGYPVGLSDHTKGTTAAIVAVAKGATVIEKHFTLDCQMEGWDHAMSADPQTMGDLVIAASEAHSSLGSYKRVLSDNEIAMRPAMRRSVCSAVTIKAGDIIKLSDLTYRRPGGGYSPNEASLLVGRKAIRDIDEDVVIQPEDVGL